MRTLLKNGTVVNVFTDKLEPWDVLLEDAKIIGTGDYSPEDADVAEDVSGMYICPGFIDGHIHIESTMMIPGQLAKAVVPHGTAALVADPHEIANVCGTEGIDYMIGMSENLPMSVYFMLPSCVPATGFDESGAKLAAADLAPYYAHPRVLGLAEMMDYPGVIGAKPEIVEKIKDALEHGKTVDGHAPLLSGHGLDQYIAAGVRSDHECSSFEEAAERISKGQWVMIRQGGAARNLEALIELFEEPWSRRCLLVTDDQNPAELLEKGHIDSIIRQAAALGKSPITGIRMATIQAAQCFGLRDMGAVAPGYRADLLVLEDLDTVAVRDVYYGGKKVVSNRSLHGFQMPVMGEEKQRRVTHSFSVKHLRAEDFLMEKVSEKCRVIQVLQGQLLTEERIAEIQWEENNGIDLKRDILKLAVIERHKGTGRKGLGFISGMNLKRGAIASSVSHDSHNLIVIGTNEEDMADAANRVIGMGGGCAAVDKGKTLAKLPLPVAGLMSRAEGKEIAEGSRRMRKTIHSLGVPEEIEPLMNMAFVSLPVIPFLKMTTKGLVDVEKQEIVSLGKEGDA